MSDWKIRNNTNKSGSKEAKHDNAFPGVSTDELEELKEAFDLFDKDGGGTIDGISTYLWQELIMHY